MPVAFISALIALIPMIPQMTADAVNFVQKVRELISGAPAESQAQLLAEWDAMRAKVLAADGAWQDAGHLDMPAPEPVPEPDPAG